MKDSQPVGTGSRRSQRHFPRTLAALLAILAMSVCPLSAATLLVPQDYSAIQNAIEAAQDGDSVLVSPGVYYESLNYLGKAITVKSAEGPLKTTITNERTVNLVRFQNGETSAAVLDGFTLQGGWIAVLITSSAPTITHNICRDQNVWNWAAICISGPLDTVSSAPADPRYKPVYGDAPAVIVNNTVVNSANGGISMFSIAPPTIRNNIVAFNTNYGIHQQSPTEQEPPIIGYNDVFGHGDFADGPYGDYINITDPGPDSIRLHPWFTLEYSLKQGSPCIDAGDPDPVYNDPDGSRNDMGALPFTGGAAPGGQVRLVPQDYLTIQAAIEASRDGDTVLVSPGTYRESLDYLGKRIVVKAVEDPLNTIITNDRTVTLVNFTHYETPEAVLEGFTLQGGWIAVLMSNSAATIRGNVCRGQNVWNWSAIAMSGKIDTIPDQTGDPRYRAHRGYAPAVVVNNTIVNSANGGMYTFSYYAPTIMNNIVAFNKNYGIAHQSEDPTMQEPPLLGYNDVYGQGEFDGSPHGDYINVPDPGPDSFRLDPKFSYWYTLKPASPCVDAGNPDAAYNDPDGTRNDIGALPLRAGCCQGLVGDANQSGVDSPTLADITAMIDAVFVSGNCEGILNCIPEADVNQSGGLNPTCNDVTIADISALIDYLFITGVSRGLPSCQ